MRIDVDRLVELFKKIWKRLWWLGFSVGKLGFFFRLWFCFFFSSNVVCIIWYDFDVIDDIFVWFDEGENIVGIKVVVVVFIV